MAEHAVVDGQAHSGALHLAVAGLAPELPHHLAHLGDGLSGHRLAEGAQPARRVHRDAPTQRGVASSGRLACPDQTAQYTAITF